MTDAPTDPAPAAALALTTLRRGSRGELVTLVQTFLRGRDQYHGASDGDFGPATEAAVRAFQDEHRLRPDGVIGNGTWGALMGEGLTLLPSDEPDDLRDGANWPPRPANLRPLTQAQKGVMFGTFDAMPSPQPGNPEAIVVTNRSEKFRIVEVALPQLAHVTGFPASGKILFHASGARPLQQLVDAWQAAGLLPKILTWAGSYAPRFIRCSRTVLSSHAFGTAFDINAGWNALGAQPMLAGRRGSVRELVPLANAHGFYWGGHFGRTDGMHFELTEVA